MTEIVQTRFCGSSVCNWQHNLGYNEQSTQFTVMLVDDPTNGDAFLPPQIGSPVTFAMGTFRYSGLLQNYERKNDTQGNPIYEVVLTDPREVLAGVQVILGGYTTSPTILGDTDSTFGVPNLINAYGYCESFGFGSSDITSAGMPWNAVLGAVRDITRGFGGIYGGAIKFAGFNYIVDLSELPAVPAEYRISGTSASLMDLISQVCNDFSCDFYVVLEQSILGNIIKIKTISRKFQPDLTVINRFIASQPNLISHSRGQELRNEPTSVFLTGGPVTMLSTAVVDASGVSARNRQIWPFWGFDASGNAVIGEGDTALSPFANRSSLEKVVVGEGGAVFTFSPDEQYTNRDHENVNYGYGRGILTDGHTFMVDWRPFLADVDDGGFGERITDTVTGDTWHFGIDYPFNVGMLRAAIAGQDEWESYFAANDPIDARLFKIDGHLGNILTTYNKLLDIEANGGSANDKKIKADELVNTSARRLFDSQYKFEGIFDTINQLYEYTSMFATEFYGKKWLCRIPFNIQAKRDSETNELSINVEPTDAAYYQEGRAPLGLDSMAKNLFTLPDGRYTAFAKFTNISGLRYRHLDQSDYFLTDDSGTLFVKGEVQPGVCFTDWQTARDPRVVFNQAGAVYLDDTEDEINRLVQLHLSIYQKQRLNDNPNAAPLTQQQQDFIETVYKNTLNQPGAQNALGVYGQTVAIPDEIAIPLKSNVETYGPWWGIGAEGKVHFEQDDSLTPWNYGGYENMNLAAQAKIEEAISYMQSAEIGSFEIPGLPIMAVGDALMGNGPIITNLDININSEKISTTYRMRTYSPKFGTLTRLNAEKFRTINAKLLQQERNFREIANNAAGRLNIGQFKTDAEKRVLSDFKGRRDLRSSRSPHTVLFGESMNNFSRDTEGTLGYKSIGLAFDTLNGAASNLGSGVNDGYKKAVVGLEFLFTPFHTLPVDVRTAAAYEPYSYLPIAKTTDYVLDDVITPLPEQVFSTDPSFIQPGFVGFGENHNRSTALYEEVYKQKRRSVDILTNEYGNTNINTASHILGLTPAQVSGFDDSYYRGIAMKMPMILSGWGFDINGWPTPRETVSSDTWVSGVEFNPVSWKTGPLDVRWDSIKKAWVAPPNPIPQYFVGTITNYHHISGILVSLGPTASILCNNTWNYPVANGDVVGVVAPYFAGGSNPSPYGLIVNMIQGTLKAVTSVVCDGGAIAYSVRDLAACMPTNTGTPLDIDDSRMWDLGTQ